MSNNFSKKIQNLTNLELLDRIENPNSYIPEAIEASIEEIKKRKLEIKDPEKLEILQRELQINKNRGINIEEKNRHTSEKFKSLDNDKFVGFGTRLTAAFLDLIIGFIVLLISAFFLSIFTSILSDQQRLVVSNLYILFFWWLYFAILESSHYQATIGKKILKIKVVDNNGLKISFSNGTLRFLSKICSGLIIFIGFLMIIGDSKRQALHDRFSNTFVIKDEI